MMNSFLRYLGGKSILSKQIIPLIPADHTTYCEVFAGAAWLFFKKEPSKVEIINDINNDLVTLYRVVKNHLEEFAKWFKWMLIGREEYQRLKGENPESLTDIQKAARFYYLLRCGYGGKLSFNYVTSTTRKAPINLMRLEEELSAAHLRLNRVYIERLPYDKCIERFDRPETFFYIDPPYWDCETDYGKDIFSKDDFLCLRDILLKVKGKFIMSINDVPQIREMYKAFNIQEVQTRYSVGVPKGEAKKVTELLIMNY